MSEPKRSAFRKEYLIHNSMYGTVETIETPLSEIRKDPLSMFKTSRRHFHGAVLIDLAVGNRDEVLYAIRPAAMRFPDLLLPILRHRDLTRLIPAITKNLLADRSGSLQTWSLLVDAGLIPMAWDDRTVMMICDSESPSDFALLRELIANSPQWNEVVYHMCEVDNWLVSSVSQGSRAALDMIDSLTKATNAIGLDRMRMLKSSLAGMFLVKNQNHSRSCEMIFDFIAPTIDELAECQADLCSVLNHGKPVSFNFCLEKLARLATEERVDWPLVGPSLGAALSRSGLAQANSAIKLLQSAADSATQAAADSAPVLDCICQALTQALLHSKREIAERAWKVLVPVLARASEHVINEIEQASQHVQGALGQTIANHLKATSHSAENTNGVTVGTDTTSETNWDELIVQLEALPFAVRHTLKCKDACMAAYSAALPDSFDWGLSNSCVLPTCEKLNPIQSIDELVLRIGRIEHSKESNFEEPELILDGMCRLPRSMDAQFASKTAAIRKSALEGSGGGLSNHYALPDYAFAILNWLGESIPDALDRYIRRQFEEVAHFLVAATLPWIREGRSFQLTSTPTHRGGWLDPHTWLDRLEAAHSAQSELLFEDIELALLRLAPDGRTTPVRDASLLERARKLEGAHAPMVRYAMGESIAWEEMTGSKRLWIAAISGTTPACSIPEQAAFFGSVTDPAVRAPTEWSVDFAQQINTMSRARHCSLALKGTELRQWRPKQLETIQLGYPFQSSPDRVDNIYLSRYVLSQALSPYGGSLVRCMTPQRQDWYFNSLLNSLTVQSTKKDDSLASDTSSPWFESERPLTLHSARALWLASLSKGDVSKVWLQELWASLIEQDRLNTPLLVQAASELARYEWCVAKRWGELLAPVASRSRLHAWELARLALGLIGKIELDQKDVLGLIEIIHDAHTTLGIAVTPQEKVVLANYATGKCKKLVAEIVEIVDQTTQQRTRAAGEKLMIRLARAEAWTHAIPDDRRMPIALTDSEIESERIDVSQLAERQALRSRELNANAAVAAAEPDSTTGAGADGDMSEERVATVKATAAKSRTAASKKKSQPAPVNVPLERSAAATRLLRASVPALACASNFDYYLGWADDCLDREAKLRCSAEDRYLLFLFHHLGLPVPLSPGRISQMLQQAFAVSTVDHNDLSMTWLASLATSFATGNLSGAKALLDRLDLDGGGYFSDPPATVLALACMATNSLRSSPLIIANSLMLQLEKDKKLAHFVELCHHIERRDSAGFAKAFESSARKVANELSKLMKGEERWKLRWWPSALLTVIWHAASHIGLDCSAIPTKAMGLVPSTSTIEPSDQENPSLTLPVPANRDQLSLQILDRTLNSAGVKYALVRPRVNTRLLSPHPTEWTIVVDARDEQAWNRLFDSHDPSECLLNAELQYDSPADYQVVLARIPQYGTTFRRLALPEQLMLQILEKAERREFYGTQVTLAPLEEAVGLLMPLIQSLSSDPRMLTGKAQNRAFYRSQLDESYKWIMDLLKDATEPIIWPKIQAVANQLNVPRAVELVKSHWERKA